MTMTNLFPNKNLKRQQKESERMKSVMRARRRIEDIRDCHDIGLKPQDYHLVLTH
ncbi:hypothetical protein [Vibrio sinensis]|uniref:hypothetical protein n=1 Tax=Vibrio sinensis TaxID=2302434 RepID=UPI001403471A|nr:hypothetical protein [Vibrio sinensis]